MKKLTFAQRMLHVPPSFLRGIFKYVSDPKVISFAGGLPNPELFPVDEFTEATTKVLQNYSHTALQYGNTEGYLPLREFIASQYKIKEGLEARAEHILITNGSQQALDLLGKVLVNPRDVIAVENPTYLAAIQAFSVYEPEFQSFTVEEDGPRIQELEHIIAYHQPKILYAIPNFQNPMGITWSNDKRRAVAELLKDTDTLFIEDDPYGEIRWTGTRPQTATHLMQHAVLLGSFSKTVAPGLRLGWIYTQDTELLEKLIIVKQASDLHSSTFAQQVLYEYLAGRTSDAHIQEIASAYHAQKEAMVSALNTYLPEVTHTNPEGGMFVWVTFPEGTDTQELFSYALSEGVAFVPGIGFYADQATAPRNSARLNFSCTNESTISEGVQRLARAYKRLIEKTA